MRTKNSAINIGFGISGQVVSSLLNFVARTIFIKILGAEYLGLNGLFSDILSVLSLAELGIANAITFSLYKPISEQDEEKVSAIVNLYGTAYRAVGIFIAVVGCSLIPFLSLIIKDQTNISNISFIYLLYLLNTVVTYFFSYKRSIITAHQKNYICTIYNNVFLVLQHVLMIVVLIFTKDFILYLWVQISFSFLTNFAISLKADKLYPYLKANRKLKLEKAERKKIFKNIKAMFMHKIGGTVLNSTDNIIISSFIGIITVGIYSNYRLIISIINKFSLLIFDSILASVGNLGAKGDNIKLFKIYKSLNLVAAFVYSICAVCLIVMFNPFIELWAGKSYVFDFPVVLMIVLNFYLTGMRKCTLMFRDALGLFWKDRYKPIAEAVINLIISLILVQYMGITGVLIGTFISTISTSLWIEPYVLYKYGFNQSLSHYFKCFTQYSIITIASAALSYYMCNLLTGLNLLTLISKFVLCIIITSFLYYITFLQTQEFKELINIVGSIFKMKTRTQENKC
jgi:O-antigen/teichoic acid export membrane protein